MSNHEHLLSRSTLEAISEFADATVEATRGLDKATASRSDGHKSSAASYAAKVIAKCSVDLPSRATGRDTSEAKRLFSGFMSKAPPVCFNRGVKRRGSNIDTGPRKQTGAKGSTDSESNPETFDKQENWSPRMSQIVDLSSPTQRSSPSAISISSASRHESELRSSEAASYAGGNVPTRESAGLQTLDNNATPSNDLAKALSSLEPGRRLDAMVIDAILRIVAPSSCRILDPFYVSTIGIKAIRSMKPLGVKPHQHLIIAPIYHLRHWTLAIWDLKTKIVAHYDSLNYKSNRLIVKLRSMIPHFGMTTVGWLVKVGICPQQQESDSCGIHVLVNALHEITSVRIPSTYNCKLWRRSFYLLLEPEVTKPESCLQPWLGVPSPLRRDSEDELSSLSGRPHDLTASKSRMINTSIALNDIQCVFLGVYQMSVYALHLVTPLNRARQRELARWRTLSAHGIHLAPSVESFHEAKELTEASIGELEANVERYTKAIAVREVHLKKLQKVLADLEDMQTTHLLEVEKFEHETEESLGATDK